MRVKYETNCYIYNMSTVSLLKSNIVPVTEKIQFSPQNLHYNKQTNKQTWN